MCISDKSEQTPHLHRKTPEVADIFRLHSNKLKSITKEQQRIIHDITSCRSAELGGHVLKCACGLRIHGDLIQLMQKQILIPFRGHCPKCQSLAKARWIEERKSELLPVHYFHVVFTIPDLLNPIALYNKRVVYNILLKSCFEKPLKKLLLIPEILRLKLGL